MDEKLLRNLFELAKINDFETDTEILNAGFESIELFNRIKGISDNIDNLVKIVVNVDSKERQIQNRQQWINTAIRMLLNKEE